MELGVVVLQIRIHHIQLVWRVAVDTEVDTVIGSGEKSVDVYVAEDKWYGVTYKEDKQTVVDAVKALVDQGLYPEL